jgi:glycosyltransferase involved in cell wall biosynthesis
MSNDPISRTGFVFLTWNRVNTLKSTLKKFQHYHKGYHDKDIVIVDNGSTDGTVDFLKKSHYNVIYNEKNLGAQLGKYIGWTWAYEQGYDFIIFIEDDFPCVRTIPLNTLEGYLDENQDIGYVRLNHKKLRKTHKVTKELHTYRDYHYYRGHKFRKSNYHFTCNPIIFRSSLVPFFKGAKTEVDYMRWYLEQYDLMSFLEDFCFKTVMRKRPKSWKN